MTHALPRATVDHRRAPAAAGRRIVAASRLMVPKLRSIRPSLLWLLPALVLTALVRTTNIAGSPQRTDAEGSLVAHAYTFDRFGGLTPYTSWYDQQPLSWLQLAGWAGLTGAFDSTIGALAAGRQLMVIAGLLAGVLLWLAARRLGLSRPGSTAVLALFALSPLAMQYQRMVFAENLAALWLLVALVSVLISPRRTLAASTAVAVIAGLCTAAAIASSELALIVAPFLIWQAWRTHRHCSRRVRLVATGGLAATAILGLALLSVLVEASLPGSGRVGAFSAFDLLLQGWGAGSSLLDPTARAAASLTQWWRLDPVLTVAGPVAALAALGHRRFWPYAGALLALTAVLLNRPGQLTEASVILLLPFAALLIPASVEIWVATALRKRAVTRPRRAIRTAAATLRRVLAPIPAVATVAAAAVGLAVAVPIWGDQLRAHLTDDRDLPVRQAVLWLDQNVDRDQRLVVGAGVWADLVRAGFPMTGVIPYEVSGRDPATDTAFGWRDDDYVVATGSMRVAADLSTRTTDALFNSVPVATFGAGADAVEVYRVQPEGAAAAVDGAAAEQRAREDIGSELVGNQALQLPTDVAELVRAGQVDPRLLLTLPPVAGSLSGRLSVSALPPVFGEAAAQGSPGGAPTVRDLRRQAWLTAVDGRVLDRNNPDTDAVVKLFQGQAEQFRPRAIQRRPDGVLITYGIDAPTGLLPSTA